jgi:hypothetical protein
MKISTDFTPSVNFINKLACFSPYSAIALLVIFLAGAMPVRAGGQQPANTYEPEIVRLSYVQGDVRLSRGGRDGADLKSSWEIAPKNMPIAEGFSLATGVGRAEIEFESGTILYLADNSVLEFNRLDSTYSVPITDLELVTGTATLDAKPMPRELFVISTPSERLSFPSAALVRIDSFLDGVTATPQNEKGDDVVEYGGDASPFGGGPLSVSANGVSYTVNLPASLPSAIGAYLMRNVPNKVHLNGGQPITYQNSKRVTGNVANDSATPADWDGWVSARVAKRQEELSAAMKAAGLTAPVPGLVDMYESGKFYPCEPDGQCWRPNGVDGSEGVIDLGDGALLPDGTTLPDGTLSSNSSAVASDGETDFGLIASLGAPVFPVNGFWPLQSQATQQSAGPQIDARQGSTQRTQPGTILPGGQRQPTVTVYRVRLDECSDEVRRQEVMTDPVTGRQILLRETVEYDPWMWGLCYSGGWIPFRGRYRFVAGRTHHHPVNFMHIGHKDCWVPRHPHDVRGKTPLNLKNGAFTAGKKSGDALQFVKWNPSDKFKVLTTTPKAFRPEPEKAGRIPVQRPVIQAWLVSRAPVTTARTQPGAKSTLISSTKTGDRSITYNYHSKTFERAGGEPVGGHTSAKPEVVGHFTANGQFNSGANGSSHGNGGGATAGGRTSGGGGGGYSGGGHSGGYSGGGSGGHSGGGGGGYGGGGGSSGGGGGGGHSGGGGGGGGSSGGGGGHGH